MVKRQLLNPESIELKSVQMSILTFKVDGTELEEDKKSYRIKVSYSAMNKVGGYTSDNSIVEYKNGIYDKEVINESDDDGWRKVYHICNSSFQGEDTQSILIDFDVEKMQKWIDE